MSSILIRGKLSTRCTTVVSCWPTWGSVRLWSLQHITSRRRRQKMFTLSRRPRKETVSIGMRSFRGWASERVKALQLRAYYMWILGITSESTPKSKMLFSSLTNSGWWAAGLGLANSTRLRSRIRGSYLLLHLGTRGWIIFPCLWRMGSIRTVVSSSSRMSSTIVFRSSQKSRDTLESQDCSGIDSDSSSRCYFSKDIPQG